MEKNYRNLKWKIISNVMGKLDKPQTLIITEYDQIDPESYGDKLDTYYAFVNLTTHDVEYVAKNTTVELAIKNMLSVLTNLGFEFADLPADNTREFF